MGNEILCCGSERHQQQEQKDKRTQFKPGNNNQFNKVELSSFQSSTNSDRPESESLQIEKWNSSEQSPSPVKQTEIVDTRSCKPRFQPVLSVISENLNEEQIEILMNMMSEYEFKEGMSYGTGPSHSHPYKRSKSVCKSETKNHRRNSQDLYTPQAQQEQAKPVSSFIENSYQSPPKDRLIKPIVIQVTDEDGEEDDFELEPGQQTPTPKAEYFEQGSLIQSFDDGDTDHMLNFLHGLSEEEKANIMAKLALASQGSFVTAGMSSKDGVRSRHEFQNSQISV